MNGNQQQAPASTREYQDNLISAIPNPSHSVATAVPNSSALKAELPITLSLSPPPIHPRLQQTGLTLALVGAAIALYKLERLLERSTKSQ